jgi:S1-C subfamily serine protease
MRLNLSTAQFKGLVRAVQAAFNQSELDTLLQQELGRQLADLVPLPDLYPSIVTNLVARAEAHGFTDSLALAVAAWRPHDSALSATVRSIVGTPGQGAALALSTDSRGAAATDAAALEGLVRGPAAYADLDQFLADLARIGARVCRIERLHTDGQPPQPLGTGFLVGNDRVLTNQHVAELLPAQGAQIGCRFDYRALPGGTAVRPGVLVQAHDTQPVLAQRGWADSDVRAGGVPPTPQQLDYALLQLAEPAGQFPSGRSDEFAGGSARGFFTLGAAPVPAPGQDLFVLQHPTGSPLKLAVGRVQPGLPSTPLRLQHDAPTEAGSSGSPCFNQRLELVALHHATDPLDPAAPRFNQAIPLALVKADLQAQGLL